ncbi:MAG: hypothetical protein AAB649_00955 [Patescibacteria group bacterium]
MKRKLYVLTALIVVALILVGVFYYRQYQQKKIAPVAKMNSLSQENFIAHMGNATYQVDGKAMLLRKGRNADDTLLLNTDLLTIGDLAGDNAATAVTVLNDTASSNNYLIALVQQGPNSKAYRILKALPLGTSEVTAITITANTVVVETKDGSRTFTYSGSQLTEKK